MNNIKANEKENLLTSALSPTPDITGTNMPILSPTPIPTPTPKPKYHSGEVWLNSHTYLVGCNGKPIVLVSNAYAKNPTLTQLLDFIRSDQTDKIPYTSTFVCADFAETLYNNAETQGIKAAYIVLPRPDHSLNAFQTMTLVLSS